VSSPWWRVWWRRPGGVTRITPQGDVAPAARRYCGFRMFDQLLPDRRQNRQPVWFVADAAVMLMFIWITVESLRSSAYVDEYGPIQGLGWLLAISPTLLLLVRRAAPTTSLAIATVLYMVASGFQGDSNAPLAIPFFAYSVGLTRPLRVSGAMVGVAAVAMSTSVFYGPGDPVVLSVPVTVMLFGIGWLIAVSIRRNQAAALHMAIEADTARSEAATAVQRAIADERARIAHELHDAVGHAVNVMVVHAGAARLAAGDQQTTETLHNIERIGRAALGDLDHLLGLLDPQPDGDPVPLQPLRGIADIDRLVGEMRAAGADVQIHNQCKGLLDDTVSRPVGTAVYRIVQEALTNALKHAGPARIDVTISCTHTGLTVNVTDNGRGGEAQASSGGRGIAGMTERAAVLGGHLTAGPIEGGGFQVHATFPRSGTSESPGPVERHIGTRP